MIRRKAFIFDIDKTLTCLHTGGKFDPTVMNIIYVMGGQDRINILRELFLNIRNLGYLIFINTRGYKDSAVQLLKECNLLDTVTNREDGVYAALTDKKTNTTKFDMDSPYWNLHKVAYLDDIKCQYGLSKKRMYFFDDTLSNIRTAVEFGYPNSFIICNDLDIVISDIIHRKCGCF